MNDKQFHTISTEETLNMLESSKNGLSANKRIVRLKKYGKNELEEKGGRGPGRIILDQILSTMVVLLIIAGAVAGLLGDDKEMFAIFAIVILFVILGFVQEYRAEKAMQSLKKLSTPRVRVRIEGTQQEISATELVSGDIVILEAGNIIPADCRIIEAHNLKVQESMLTGENEAVEKSEAALDKDNLPIGDRKNSLFMGTVATYGRGEAVVTGTGMATELGKIAFMIQNVKESMTPLQKQLDKVGKNLAILGVICALVVILVGYLNGGKLKDLLMSGVSVAVAVIPEGLPAVITITLAIGAQKMLRRKALIRKLSAVETLGSVNVICSDKTGTLTENKMTLTNISSSDASFELNQTSQKLDELSTPLKALLLCGILCNDGKIIKKDDTKESVGDPTETAILNGADKLGFDIEKVLSSFKRIDEIPFDSERKRMSTLHKGASNSTFKELFKDGDFVAFTKGSVDGLISICDRYLSSEGIKPLTNTEKEKILSANNALSSNAVRVLGGAFKTYEKADKPSETNLVFVGLFGMIDPPRPEAKIAIETCKSAGIRTIMITGDHPLTAKSIAQKIGIADNPEVITGEKLESLKGEELDKTILKTCVFARVSPKDKLKIVEVLQSHSCIVAMTGDGVNDSPALKKADIGIAMGITGTDVSKEASKMILLDDNFSTIVNAVEQGRIIYDNIKRYICFSVGGNIGKVIVMLSAPVFGVAIALFPIQLLWLNLLTDGLLGIGLGVEKSESGVMKKHPRKAGSSIFSDGALAQTLIVGLSVGLLALIVGYFYLLTSPAKWETMLFNSIAFIQIGQALGVRSNTDSFFSYRFKGNRVLMSMIIIIIILQFCVVYIPQLSPFFNVIPLTLIDWIVCLICGFIMIIILEVIKKLLYREIN
ncbi:MAG: cation-translocating P-type ATPase [Lentisphaerota bacterium]